MPKKRHLLIAIGTDKKSKSIVDDEIYYRLSKKKEELVGEFCAGKKGTFKKAKGDVIAVAYLHDDLGKGKDENEILLRRCLEWLVDGAETNKNRNDSSRKISIICHGSGTTSVSSHAQVSMSAHTLMSCICEAGRTIDRSLEASVAWAKQKSCKNCGKSFVVSKFFTKGRHHCRICGGSFCETCCTKETVSFGMESKGSAAAAASSPTSWVCLKCPRNKQNLLSKVGVLRLLVCSGAKKVLTSGKSYVPPSRWKRIRPLPHSDQLKYYGGANYRLFPKDVTFPENIGQQPMPLKNCLQQRYDTAMAEEKYLEAGRLHTMLKMNGNPVDFLPKTVAGTAFNVLRKNGVRGVKVTAAGGVIMNGGGSPPYVLLNVKPGVWTDMEYDPTDPKNKGYDLKIVKTLGSADTIAFSKAKVFCVT